MGFKPSPYPHGSKKDRDYHLNIVIPFFTFFAKVGSYITMYLAFQVSFSNPFIFPIMKRSTAIGICNFVARGLTIFASLLAEVDAPIPVLSLLILNLIGFITALFLPSNKQEKDDLEFVETKSKKELSISKDGESDGEKKEL
jgi:lipopolysaccharide export LptBFGC system permease protein LptF